jgi:hypothetical protein
VTERPELIPPLEVIEVARCTMGAIDLDPYGSADGNRVVQAARFLERSGDLELVSQRAWTSSGGNRLLLAVPAGLRLARALATRLLVEYRAGRVQQAVFWCGNSEILAACPWLWDFPICLPFRRLAPRYWDDEIEQAVRVSPAGWSAIVYLPPAAPAEAFQRGLAAFSAAAGPYGRVLLDQWSGDNEWWPASYRALTGREPPGL